jgi:hypothetical protein
MNNIILGIDISKKKFDVALLINNKMQTKKFDNSSKGFDVMNYSAASDRVSKKI